MPSLYDLMQPSQPAMFDMYDMPNVGASATPTPATQAGMGDTAQPGWMALLTQMAQQNNRGTGAGMGPSGAQPLTSSAASRKGFISDSRSGFNLDDLMKVAAMAGTMGMATPAVAGAAGAAGGASAAGGMGSMGGIMNMFGGMMGGGGGGGSSGPRMSYAPLPQQRGPLVPQSAAQWGVAENPWMFQG